MFALLCGGRTGWGPARVFVYCTDACGSFAHGATRARGPWHHRSPQPPPLDWKSCCTSVGRAACGEWALLLAGTSGPRHARPTAPARRCQSPRRAKRQSVGSVCVSLSSSGSHMAGERFPVPSRPWVPVFLRYPRPHLCMHGRSPRADWASSVGPGRRFSRHMRRQMKDARQQHDPGYSEAFPVLRLRRSRAISRPWALRTTRRRTNLVTGIAAAVQSAAYFALRPWPRRWLPLRGRCCENKLARISARRGPHRSSVLWKMQVRSNVSPWHRVCRGEVKPSPEGRPVRRGRRRRRARAVAMR